MRNLSANAHIKAQQNRVPFQKPGCRKKMRGVTEGVNIAVKVMRCKQYCAQGLLKRCLLYEVGEIFGSDGCDHHDIGYSEQLPLAFMTHHIFIHRW